MKWLNILKVSLLSIMKNKMRSFLTSLGIIIGVCSVIVMVGVGRGSSKQIEQNIQSMGTNMIIVGNARFRFRGVSSSDRNELSFDDVEFLQENGKNFTDISANVRTSAQVVANGNNINTSIEGVEPPYLNIRKWEIETGTMFTDRDVTSKKKVCLLGQTVIEELYGDSGIDPVGSRIRIRNTPFKVIGTLKEKGENQMGHDQDDLILMPVTTALYRLKGGTSLDQIYISANSAEVVDQAIAEVEQLMLRAHEQADLENADFWVRSQSELTDMMTSTADTMTALLAAIAGVSLIVGGIGIMNIMLVSVTERTREIGIRLSVGARGKDVMMQFLTESIVLSMIGGITGILLAFGLIFILNNYAGLPAVAEPKIITISFLFAGFVGVFFGWYPARKASRLNPIDALRYE